MQLTLDSFLFILKKEKNRKIKKIDGRSREARLIKAKQTRKEIFNQLKKCAVKIVVPEFYEAVQGAQSYYLYKSQWNDGYYGDEYENVPYLNRKGFINHIRHRYTNYDRYLDILRQLDSIPFTYRLMLGYETELKAYKWLKNRFNQAIEMSCYAILTQFEEWQNENVFVK